MRSTRWTAILHAFLRIPMVACSLHRQDQPLACCRWSRRSTAMRHELKLQTKSSRGLEESVQSARQGLDEAIRHFRSIQSREEQSAERAALPLAEAMAGLDEGLWRAGMAFEQAHDQITRAVPQRVRQVLAEEFERLPTWRKWLVGNWPERLQRRCAEVVSDLNAEEFVRLLDGFRLIQQRTQQELERHSLRRLDVVGRRVDPACMTVVAVADSSEGPAETVVEELRPGYYWRDRVLRFAEVRAVAATKQRPSISLETRIENNHATEVTETTESNDEMNG